MALKRMSIKVSEDLYNYIAAEAEKDGLSMNAVIIFALNNYRRENMVVPQLGAMAEMYGQMEKRKQV